MSTDEMPTFDEHAIVELIGHRRMAGRVREVQLAGAGMLRVDVPAAGGQPASTHFFGPGAVYGIHPVGEDVAAAVAARCRPAPVQRWELPAAPYRAADVVDEDQDDDEDDDEDLDEDLDEDGPDLDGAGPF
jgi:hypothetical protein